MQKGMGAQLNWQAAQRTAPPLPHAAAGNSSARDAKEKGMGVQGIQ